MSDKVFNKLTKKDSMNHWRAMKYRKIYTGILYVFSALALSLFPQFASIVKATSVYDNYLQPANALKIYRDTTGTMHDCSEVDMTTSAADPLMLYSGSNPYILEAKESFFEALANGGKWGITQRDVSYGGESEKDYIIFWTEDDSLGLRWDSVALPDIILAASMSGTTVLGGVKLVTVSGAAWSFEAPCTPVISYWSLDGTESPVVSTAYPNRYSFVLNADQYNYPSGYEGYVIPGATDVDSDGLNWAHERLQGTLDSKEDTDGDGLSDLTESVWFEDRTSVFCDTVPDPDVCAYPNPLEKDLYIEIDWMDDGVTAYKPNSTQIGLLESAFDNKGINLHVDTGEFGGGNELPVYISALTFAPEINVTDFFNLKNGDQTYDPNFSEDRRGIWRYMITGNQMDDGGDDDTSGVSYGGDDDSFVALGQVSSDHPLAVNSAVAGTMIHELGHNLCLTDENNDYPGQDEDCIFEGIDSYFGNDYLSSMNYDKQFLMVDYSDGLNLADDHDDWSAILLGMDDFIAWDDPPEGALRGGFNKQPIYNR